MHQNTKEVFLIFYNDKLFKAVAVTALDTLRSTLILANMGQLPISLNCVFDASLVPGTCLERFLDLKGLINKLQESPANRTCSY